MRRLQTHEHRDCTCRGTLGRRNRYVHSAQMIPNRNARRNSVHEARILGHGGAFPFSHTGAGQFSSAYLKKRVTYPCPAPVSESQGLNHDRSFLFCSGNTRTYNIITRSKTVRRRLALDTSAAQSGAAELRNAVRCSVSWPIVGNLGTPAVNKSSHTNLRFFCGGTFLFYSGKTQVNNITIRSRTVKQGINRYASAAPDCAAEFRNAAADFFRSSTPNRRCPTL